VGKKSKESRYGGGGIREGGTIKKGGGGGGAVEFDQKKLSGVQYPARRGGKSLPPFVGLQKKVGKKRKDQPLISKITGEYRCGEFFFFEEAKREGGKLLQ